MSYGIQDNLGVWVVVPDGNFPSRMEAQIECDNRNFEDGCADASGKLLEEIPIERFSAFYVKHRARPDCTCRPERDPLGKCLQEVAGLAQR